MSNSIKYLKLDEDDILEILIEYHQEQGDFYDFGKGIILGSPGDNLRFVAVLGKERDEEIRNTDLYTLDASLDYNGSHSFLKNHPEFYISPVEAAECLKHLNE